MASTQDGTTSSTTGEVTIGVLALQGAFREHLTALSEVGQYIPNTRIKTIQVRTPSELDQCDALILPGGESTAISIVAQRTGMLEPLREFVRQARGYEVPGGERKRAVWGTCAGMILLADEVVGASMKKGGQEGLGGMGIRVVRNQFGRQIESFEHDLDIPDLRNPEEPFKAIFIRAPILHTLLNPIDPSSKAHSSLDPNPSSSSSSSLKDQRPPIEIIATVPPEVLPRAPSGGPNDQPSYFSSTSSQSPPSPAPSHPSVISLPQSSASVLTPSTQISLTPGLSISPQGNGSETPKTPIPLGPHADVVACRQGRLMVCSFHPELTPDVRIHEYWIRKCVLRE